MDEWQLRQLFNAGNYESDLRANRLVARTAYNKQEYLEGRANPCRSYRDEWVDGQGSVIASVHYYKCRDGWRSRPDPKALVHNGVLYVLGPTEPQ